MQANLATKLAIVAAILAAALSPSNAAEKWNMTGPAPHLVAHYIPWFSFGDSTGWQGWTRSINSAKHDAKNHLPDGKRDIASVCYPLIGPYSSTDHAVVRYHLATMKAAGIQGVFIDYQAEERVKERTQVVFDEAAKLDMKVTICYEEKTNFIWPTFRNPSTREAAIQYGLDDMKYIATKYATQPAFMRCNGQPMMFIWNGGGSGKLGPNYYTGDEWKSILAQMPEKFVFGRGGLDPAWSAAFDFRYSWVSPYASANFGFDRGAAKLIGDGKAKFFISSMCPGFNDSPVWGWGVGPRIVERKGLSMLRATFDEAIKGNPEVIQLVTWNDFNEGTVIEPTREAGFDNLDAIAAWTAKMRGVKADPKAIRQPFLDYIAAATPEQKAELPAGKPSEWIASRGLKVEVPDYLHTLIKKRDPANLLYATNSLESWGCGFSYKNDTKATVDGDYLRIDIGKVDDVFWHTHILQADIPLKEGQRYTLKFRAKADQTRPILALLQTMGGNSGDWHMVGLDKTVDLTTEWQEFTIPFTATKLIPDGSQFAFHMGQHTGSVWLADVTLKSGK
ncbi:MAG TPA: endo-1,3-alpha-glucanase family glycosylhydrolase [Capsulimonadaceae bacterium]|jgi:hypothetical protein